MAFERYSYSGLKDIKQKAEILGQWLPLTEDVSALLESYGICGRTAANRIVFQPMEGADGHPDGSPGELTWRRYRRFARGGPGIIWFEAVAVAPEGRANPRQLFLTAENLDGFSRLVAQMKTDCLRENGFEPIVIMQATHSGRYSRPHGAPEPLIAYHNPLFEKDHPIDRSRILSDDQLEGLEALYGQSARLARLAGFDGMDVKSCHRYLASELLSAYTRPGRYGGSLHNRSRFLMNAIGAAKAAVPSGFLVTTRLNVYDGFPYPYGFGVSPQGGLSPDLREPLELADRLQGEAGLALVNITCGNPYVNPHVNRPYDAGSYTPDEHPLTGVSRIMICASVIQKAYPSLGVVCSGLSYLRQYSPYLAAGMIRDGSAELAGFGREAFAYPDFPRDLRAGRPMDADRVCVACGQCAARLRAGLETGCVVRDREAYKPVR